VISELQGILDLPPLSTTFMRVWQVVDNPDARAETLAEAISADPAFVASLLRRANSAYYGLRQSVASIPQAIMVIGSREIKRMCIALAASEGILAAGGGAKGFDRTRFWRHCVGAAFVAEALAERLRRANQDAAFTHGLLHGLGILGLDRGAPQRLEQLIEMAAERAVSPLAIEAELLGVTHGDLGAALAAKWRLPDSLQSAIQHVACPGLQPPRELELLVHIGCRFGEHHELCQDPASAPPARDVLEALGTDEDTLDDALRVARGRLTEAAGALDL
jgi:HD-like signal output (HDOD) protein